MVEEEDGEELFGDNMERYGCSLIRVIIKFLRELIFMVKHLKLCTLGLYIMHCWEFTFIIFLMYMYSYDT